MHAGDISSSVSFSLGLLAIQASKWALAGRQLWPLLPHKSKSPMTLEVLHSCFVGDPYQCRHAQD